MKRLSDLKEANVYFEMSKKGLEDKLNLATTFLDRNEFINAEIKRIEDEYSKPSISVQITDRERILDSSLSPD